MPLDFEVNGDPMSFSAAGYRFGVIPFGAAADANCSCEFEWFLDEQLEETGNLPDLHGAPLASWLIARLRAIEESLPVELNEQNDGGGYAFEMAVAVQNRIVASFQLQGDMDGIAVLGRAIDDETADEILNELVLLLVGAPLDVAECRYTIVDPDWKFDPDCFVPTPTDDSRNEYGYQNGQYLGAANIREE